MLSLSQRTHLSAITVLLFQLHGDFPSTENWGWRAVMLSRLRWCRLVRTTVSGQAARGAGAISRCPLSSVQRVPAGRALLAAPSSRPARVTTPGGGSRGRGVTQVARRSVVMAIGLVLAVLVVTGAAQVAVAADRAGVFCGVTGCTFAGGCRRPHRVTCDLSDVGTRQVSSK